VELCNRHRLAPGLAFVCGDALSMPFPAFSFDAVVNIESSHCYESMDTFLSEVCRVLRPGGRFFFADLRSMDGVNALREQFNACDPDGREGDRHHNQCPDRPAAGQCTEAGTHRRLDPASLSPAVFCVFAGIAGTRNYGGLESGKLRYLSAQLAKSSPAQA
jgi:SAM-dependent methyltransferase